MVRPHDVTVSKRRGRTCPRSPGAWFLRGPRSGGRACPCGAGGRCRRAHSALSGRWRGLSRVDPSMARISCSRSRRCRRRWRATRTWVTPRRLNQRVQWSLRSWVSTARSVLPIRDVLLLIFACACVCASAGRGAPHPCDVLLLIPVCAFAKTRRKMWQRERGLCAPRGWVRVFRALAASYASGHPARMPCERVYAIRLRALQSRSVPLVPRLPRGLEACAFCGCAVHPVRPPA